MHRQKINEKVLLDLENRFTHHPVLEGQPAKYVAIRDEAKHLAFTMAELCPPSRELSLAWTKLEEAVMHANAAIARHGVADPVDSEPSRTTSPTTT